MTYSWHNAQADNRLERRGRRRCNASLRGSELARKGCTAAQIAARTGLSGRHARRLIAEVLREQGK